MVVHRLMNTFAAEGVPLMAKRCPKGHWYDPDAPGALGRCPQCAVQTQTETSVTDDDVLAIMSMPDEPTKSAGEDPAKSGSGSAILRRKKICPECSHEASYSFDYCPRCGAPLKLAVVELRKS
jgi:hypothetical protein